MKSFAARTGLTLIELVIAAAVFATLLMIATFALQQEATSLSTISRKTYLHLRADIIMETVKSELRFAQGVDARAWLAADLAAGVTVEMTLDTTRGLPDRGHLLVEAGTANEERIEYTGLTSAPPALLNLSRGFMCGADAFHATGTQVLWAGQAAAIEDQANPPVDFYDGISMEPTGQVFYRGDGTGFAFRVPVDVDGDGTFFDAAGEVQWGADVRGATRDGYSCFYYEAVGAIAESTRAVDLNGDGDMVDLFDLGRIRMRSWDATTPGTDNIDVALGPPIVLQERCAWGGDLDGDGFQDPIFLWDPEGGRLRLRMFVMAAARKNVPQAHRVETTLFLRNGTAN